MRFENASLLKEICSEVQQNVLNTLCVNGRKELKHCPYKRKAFTLGIVLEGDCLG